jgi:aryl-alcohol dehydrogenase-like predicted oxidoreductase
VMDDLVRAGKVRWAGVSNFGVPLLDRCEAVRHVDAIQPELSLLRPEARRDVIPWARRHGSGVLVYSPLAGGMLAGTHDRKRLASLPTDDSRRRAADVIADLIDELTAVADRASLDLKHLALGWALSVEGVTAAICGARTDDQVDGWIGAVDAPLDATTLAEVEGIARHRGLM